MDAEIRKSGGKYSLSSCRDSRGAPHADHRYASTSHAAQGTTVDRVIVNVDPLRSAQLVNRRQFYVSISRSRHDARIYTDDTEALRRAVAREPRKEIALDAVRQWPPQGLKPGLTLST